MSYLNLIRYKNVLFVGVIQALMYWMVIEPTLSVYGLHHAVGSGVMWVLILSTMAIAAGAYVINDYFDVKIDRINRPDSLIVTRSVQKFEAMRLYQVLTAAGLVGGIVTAVMLRSVTLGFVFVVVPGMLWFYSASYKRQLIIGNLIVAASAALVPMLPLIAEAAALESIYRDLLHQTPILRHLYSVVCVYAGFAFLFTLIREVIKDLEDEPGDREMECHTMAVVWGHRTTKIVVTVLMVLTNVALGWMVWRMMPFDNSITMRYYAFGILLPSVCAMAILWSKSCAAYRNASAMVKFIMVIGVLYALLYSYLLAKEYGVPMFGIFKVV